MLKLVSIDKSYKKILAHSINKNGLKINKGKIISNQDIDLLKINKIEKIYVFEISSEDVNENKASIEISKKIVSNNVKFNKPINGRTDLYSKINGMIKYDKNVLYKLNYLNDDLAVAMIKSNKIVKKSTYRKC